MVSVLWLKISVGSVHSKEANQSFVAWHAKTFMSRNKLLASVPPHPFQIPCILATVKIITVSWLFWYPFVPHNITTDSFFAFFFGPPLCFLSLEFLGTSFGFSKIHVRCYTGILIKLAYQKQVMCCVTSVWVASHRPNCEHIGEESLLFALAILLYHQ